MKKDVVLVAVFLMFLFIISMAAHMLYVKGYAFGKTGDHFDESQSISIFKTQDECEAKTHASCVLQICDDIPAGKDYEDICGQGYKEGWQPKGEH